MQNKITVETVVNTSLDKAWEVFNDPEQVTQWNHASDDWHSPRATNDLRVGGQFNYRMEAKDGSQGFDFSGTYTEVVLNRKVAYEMSDGRKVETSFADLGGSTKVTTVFDPEAKNPTEFQRAGWQAILDNYKKQAEGI